MVFPGWGAIAICTLLVVMLGCFFAEPVLGVQGPGEGLVALYTFDEGEGTSVANILGFVDSAGNDGSGEIEGATWVPGREEMGSALFLGPGGRVLITAPEYLKTPNALTVAAWVRLKGPVGVRGYIINQDSGWRLFVWPDGKICFQTNIDGRWAANWITSGTSISWGEWHYIAAVYDGEKRQVFIDGVLDSEGACSGTLIQSMGNPFSIGGSTAPQEKDWFLNGEIDEIRIWKRALSSNEVMETMRMRADDLLKEASLSLSVTLGQAVTRPGEEFSLRALLFNGDRKIIQGVISGSIKTAEGTPIVTLESRKVELEAYQSVCQDWKNIIFAAPGQYIAELNWTPGGDNSPASKEVLGKFLLWVMPPHPRNNSGELTLRLVDKVDCVRDTSPMRFTDDGTSRIVNTSLGSYREAGAAQFSRFAFRYHIDNPSQPHLVRVFYPDDKNRVAEISTWSPNDKDYFNAHTGYITGDPYSTSNTIKYIDLITFPRDRDQSLVFCSWVTGRPAAASSIEIYEIEGGLPSAGIQDNSRLSGLYFEDPTLTWCLGGSKSDFAEFQRAVDNLVDYMDYVGLNLLMYPVVWYQGPLYNSLLENDGTGSERHPTNDYMQMLLLRFSERGFTLYPSINLHWLPSLRTNMNAGMEDIKKGADTYNLVLNDNRVQTDVFHGKPPIFDILRPEVQNAVINLVDEIVQRYGSQPSFGGLVFHLTKVSMLWLGGLEGGYSDWDIAQFERDTDISVPVPTEDPERFSKRYRWLMANARDQWIEWRCKRVWEFYRRVSEVIRKHRPDLRLVLMLHSPPNPHTTSEMQRWASGVDANTFFKEAGVDVELYRGMDGVIVQKVLFPLDYHWRLAHGETEGSARSSRQLDFSSQLEGFRVTEPFGIVLHQTYFETAYGQKNPLPGAWWGSIPWRASAPTASGRNFMEYYARALAGFNASQITVGGYTLGSVGHEEDLRQFNRLFRALPTGEWKDVESPEGAVVRSLTSKGETWFYAVNTTGEPLRISFRLGDSRANVKDLSDPDTAVELNASSFTIELAPFGLCAYRVEEANVSIQCVKQL